MMFNELREQVRPTSYDERRTAGYADIVFFGIIYAFAAIFLSFLVILPSFRFRSIISSFFFVAASLFIGASILVTNFGSAWESGTIKTRTKYKALSPYNINATVGLHIGLRGINITLKGTPTQQLNETIDYNEHFSWEWQQGVFGFGPQAGQMSQDYLAAKRRGMPLPILWIAEYFTYDDGALQFCRHYRQAGYYAHIVLWAALPLWFLTNIFTQISMSGSCLFASLTALCVFSANIIFALLKSQTQLNVLFEEDELIVSYSWCFWLCVATGFLCTVLAVFLGLNLLPQFKKSQWCSWLSIANRHKYDTDNSATEAKEPEATKTTTSSSDQEQTVLDQQPSTSSGVTESGDSSTKYVLKPESSGSQSSEV